MNPLTGNYSKGRTEHRFYGYVVTDITTQVQLCAVQIKLTIILVFVASMLNT